MSGFDGVQNQMNGPDSSPRLPQDDPRDQPCFPITLKVQHTHTQQTPYC